jgi:hypothetical protein
MTTCSVCHKPLTDALSVQLGMGLVCRLNLKTAEARRRDLFNSIARACYDYEIVDGVVCIIDNDRGKSVTNDAEKVIADLCNDGIDLSMPVIYRDTMGVWDRLLVAGGTFAGFAPIGTATRDEAIKKLSLVAA